MPNGNIYNRIFSIQISAKHESHRILLQSRSVGDITSYISILEQQFYRKYNSNLNQMPCATNTSLSVELVSSNQDPAVDLQHIRFLDKADKLLTFAGFSVCLWLTPFENSCRFKSVKGIYRWIQAISNLSCRFSH